MGLVTYTIYSTQKYGRCKVHSRVTTWYNTCMQQQATSWQKVAPWYNNLVGVDGHYYHKQVVLPGLLRLLDLKSDCSLLDLGCGQGVVSRVIPEIARYVGVDKAASLIDAAKNNNKNARHTFAVADVTRPLPKIDPGFSHCCVVLALQNMEKPEGVFDNLAQLLQMGGEVVIVLNHPVFRIPRQSGWGIDEKTKQQHRWINRYLSPLRIPITMNPGKKDSQTTWSFHRPLQDYISMLTNAGFIITGLEEWVSDKESEGKAAKMENRARSEFPLFLTLVAKKVS